MRTMRMGLLASIFGVLTGGIAGAIASVPKYLYELTRVRTLRTSAISEQVICKRYDYRGARPCHHTLISNPGISDHVIC